MFERECEVFLVEECRVGQTGTDHPLVTVHDLLGSLGVAVVRHDEAVVESAICPLHGEVALMTRHRVLEHLARHRQELLVEAANGNRRPFDKVDDLGEGLVGHDRAPADPGRYRLDALLSIAARAC